MLIAICSLNSVENNAFLQKLMLFASKTCQKKDLSEKQQTHIFTLNYHLSCRYFYLKLFCSHLLLWFLEARCLFFGYLSIDVGGCCVEASGISSPFPHLLVVVRQERIWRRKQLVVRKKLSQVLCYSSCTLPPPRCLQLAHKHHSISKYRIRIVLHIIATINLIINLLVGRE